MKLSSMGSRALGAMLVVASGATAIDLQVNDASSIKDAASIIAAGMTKYYTGDQPGDTPGNLPDPYYWWEAGAMFNALIDYWYYTGDDQYNAITKQAMLHQAGDDRSFMPSNQTRSLGNDDQAFWGMTAMSAAERNFDNPDPDQPQWLALAQGVFNSQAVRWDMATCGGGLKWQIFTFNNGYNYKNTISNGCFFNLAGRLARYTNNQTYVEWAERSWTWVESVGLANNEIHFFDGTDDTKNCSDVNGIQWTYNAGVFMLGAAHMYNLTESDVWKQRLEGIIRGLDVFFSKDVPNVLFEMACEPYGTCDVDQRSFKGYLARWMGSTIQVAPFTRDLLLPKLEASAAAAAAQCNGGAEQNCGLLWTNNGVNDGSLGVGEQMSALETVQSLFSIRTAGPVTNSTGGTSVGDPNAGADSSDQQLTFDPVTTGDKAGAGFLSALVLVGILAGAWWMIAN